MSVWTKEDLENMLEDVVNECELSELSIKRHGSLGTPPAELVRLILKEKDMKKRMLKHGLKSIAKKRRP